MDVFIGDTVVISLNTGMTITGYSSYIIKYRRPDGQEGIWVGDLDPADNRCVKYTTLHTDLCMAGKWSIQAYVSVGTTYLHGAWANFVVLDPVADPFNYLMYAKPANFILKLLSAELS
jgi:hypothetical protein